MVAIPNRGSGSTTGWVHPWAVQTGQWIADRASGNPIQLRGVETSDSNEQHAQFVNDPYPSLDYPTFLATLLTLGGNHYTTHLTWGNLEPYRPTGGDQTTTPPTFGSRSWNAPLWNAIEAHLQWTDANSIYVVMNQSGAGNNTNANARYPDWCFDDSLWATATGATVSSLVTAPSSPDALGNYDPFTIQTSAVSILAAGAASNGTSYPRKGWAVIGGQTVAYSKWTAAGVMTVDTNFYTPGATFSAGATITVGTDVSHHVAPFPHDRATYLAQSTAAGTVGQAGGCSAAGAYNFTDDTDQRTAQYVSGSTLVVGGVGNGGPTNNVTWHGDWDAWLSYLRGVDLQFLIAGGKHPSVIGYKWFNEPDIGLLKNTHQVGNGGAPWGDANTVLNKVLLPNYGGIFDYLRGFEPERFFCFSGQGGPNNQISPDFSILWTAAHAGGGGPCPDAYPFVQEAHLYVGGAGLPATPMDAITLACPNVANTGGIYAPDRDSNGNPSSLNAIFAALASSAGARNVPLYLGEWGCPGSATLVGGVTLAAPTYIADYAQGINANHVHQAYFTGGTSISRGMFTPAAGIPPPSYSLNSWAGVPFQAMLAVPLAPLPAPVIPTPLPTPYDQPTVDYKNAAQMRVAYDTRWLIKKATLQIVPGQQEYILASDVISVMSIVDFSTDPVAGTLIPRLRTPEAMRLLSTSDKPSWEQPMHYIVGTTLGILPVPTTSTTYTVYYHARPAVLDETAQYELTGDALRLVERLANSYSAIDDGQLEVSQAEFQIYEAEMLRVRRRIRHRAAARLYTATETGA